MPSKQLYLVPLIWILLFVAALPVHSTIRLVPQSYPDISSAVLSALAGDTILLAQGVYHESTTIDRNLTIASTWLLTRNTSAIANTTVHGSGGSAFYCAPDSGIISVRLEGLQIDIIDTDSIAQGAINGVNSDIVLNSVWVKSNVAIPAMVSPTIQLSSNTQFTANDCYFRCADNESLPLIESNGLRIEMNRCRIDGRMTLTENWLIHTRHTAIKLMDCHFKFRSRGILSEDSLEIRRTVFDRTGAYTLYLAGQRPGIVSDCQFTNLDCHDHFPYRMICNYNNEPNFVRFKNCLFLNCRGENQTNASTLFYGTGNHRLTNCVFIDNTQFSYLIHGGGVFDSLFFQNNSAPLFANHVSNRIYQVAISSSDFIGTSYMVTDPANHPSFDSFVGENCYWGDPSGPQHIFNPNGTGIIVPSYTVYTPFRTTPVFGTNDVNERQSTFYPHSLSLLTAYPNPFNSSTTIRYSLPRAGDATITVFDVNGRVVAELHGGYLPRGEGAIQWQHPKVASGIYFVHLQVNKEVTRYRIECVK